MHLGWLFRKPAKMHGFLNSSLNTLKIGLRLIPARLPARVAGSLRSAGGRSPEPEATLCEKYRKLSLLNRPTP